MNVAVIGLGWWGPKLLRNFISHPKYQNVYGFDINDSILKERLEEFKFCPLNSLEEIWQNTSINAVAIVTPVKTHYQIAKAAFEHGKHVLIAKPPASTLEEVEKLGELAHKHNLVFMADSTFVYNSAMTKVRDIVKSGQFPHLSSIQSARYGDDMRMHHVSRIRNTMLANGIDVIEDLVFHDLSVLTSLLDNNFQILTVQRIYNLHPELCDTAYIDLNVGGIPVHIENSWTLPERKRELVLYSPKKLLFFDDLKREEKVWYYHLESQKRELIHYEESEPLQNVVGHFADCIEKRKEPLTGADLMVKLTRLVEQIREWREGRNSRQ